ncbi:transmembrane protein 176 [Mugil cephalus]|uniref:transmembrane protein 176 n=1 Tax=Mugil cephalus TaxID=48193 RepID=UPI001FB5EADA|nr:transmembrane protein 176 [Mugil cephalus]
MAVSVSRDLTVQVLPDVNTVKLSDRQQELCAAVKRGEPKCLGVSQVMLGLMVMSYSIPLHVTELTQVVTLGVPWWSGLMFITAGLVAILLDKQCTLKMLQVCVIVSLVSILLSLVAVIIYAVDIGKNPEGECVGGRTCSDQHFAMKFSNGVKRALLIFTLAQTTISAVLCYLLLRQKRTFGQYASLAQDVTTSSSTLAAPDLN